MTDLEFVQWIADADPGDTIEYHAGFLFLDRTRGVESTGSDAPSIRVLADTVYDLQMRGLIELTQRRIGDYRYSYLATARRKPNAKSLDLRRQSSCGPVRHRDQTIC
jgi:hypothetical protein